MTINLGTLEAALDKFDSNTLEQSGLFYKEQAVISDAARAYLAQAKAPEQQYLVSLMRDTKQWFSDVDECLGKKAPEQDLTLTLDRINCGIVRIDHDEYRMNHETYQLLLKSIAMSQALTQRPPAQTVNVESLKRKTAFDWLLEVDRLLNACGDIQVNSPLHREIIKFINDRAPISQSDAKNSLTNLKRALMETKPQAEELCDFLEDDTIDTIETLLEYYAKGDL